LRPGVQAGLDRLREVLGKAGHAEALDRLNGLSKMDDVLRDQPALVPVLLTMAWGVRSTPAFAPLFMGLDERAVVDRRDAPILPCELSLDQVQRALLLGAARFACERREKAWCVKRARQEKDRQRMERQTQGRGLHKRLMAPLKTMLDGDEDMPPGRFRTEYPGYGLYEVLKPVLTEGWQFAFVELYARFTTPQARAVAALIPQMKTRERVQWLLAMSADDVAVIRTICRDYATMTLGLDEAAENSPSAGEDSRDPRQIGQRVSGVETKAFETVMVAYPAAVDTMRTMGLGTMAVIRRLAPVFGADIWAVMGDEEALNNARTVPDHLLSILGPVSRYIPPEVSQILTSIRDQTLACDLMSLARETFDDESLGTYLGDPDRRSLWNALPQKFNNAYRYQRDASADDGVRNLDDLRTVAGALFRSLERGPAGTV